MRIFVLYHRIKISLEVPEDIQIFDLKRILSKERRICVGDQSLFFKGQYLKEFDNLRDYNIKDGDHIQVEFNYIGGGPEPENSDYSTNIHAVNKRENIGKEYYYKIQGSNEGTVWGDHIFTDDSNIAKAAVLEGKCQLGQQVILGIRMIEGKSSYSCATKNGVSSVTYGSWPASYVFI